MSFSAGRAIVKKVGLSATCEGGRLEWIEQLSGPHSETFGQPENIYEGPGLHAADIIAVEGKKHQRIAN